MIHHLSIDIETYSSVDLKRSGLYRYAQSPDFEILLLAWSMDGQSVEIIDLARGEQVSGWLRSMLRDPNVIKHAYNAAFEITCLNRAGYTTPLNQWLCTMLHGMYCGYTAGLGPTGEALGLPQDKRKLAAGGSLIRTFCIPTKPTKTNGQRTRTLPHHEPERWQLFREYCKQDVVTEMEIARRLANFPLPTDVFYQWALDQAINSFGAAVDPALVEGALHCGAVSTDELTTEAHRLSGLKNPKSSPQLKKWLEDALAAEDEEDDSDPDNDDLVPDVTKATIAKLLGTTTDETVHRMLEIRQELAKTSVTKYAAMRDCVGVDGRVRGLIQNYGANRTGRAAGRLVQVQNLPRNHLGTLDIARRYTCAKRIDFLRFLYWNIPDTLSQLIRTAFIPSPGNRLVVVDFSAIEARVIAWLAGEAWRQEVFATHGRIYEASASQMFGVPLDLIQKGNPEYELRQRGKVAELALGYQGGTGALKKMDTAHTLREEELPDIVSRWREANKRIVGLWYAVDAAAVSTVETGRPAGVNGILFARVCDDHNDFLTITLPSGRQLFYARPRLVLNRFGRQSIAYWGVDQKKGKWAQLETYGGKLVENITQAIARDCLYHAMGRITQLGYQIVFHVHDEVVMDVPAQHADSALAAALAIMAEPIPWARGLLLKGDGGVLDYYRKD